MAQGPVAHTKNYWLSLYEMPLNRWIIRQKEN